MLSLEIHCHPKIHLVLFLERVTVLPSPSVPCPGSSSPQPSSSGILRFGILIFERRYCFLHLGTFLEFHLLALSDPLSLKKGTASIGHNTSTLPRAHSSGVSERTARQLCVTSLPNGCILLAAIPLLKPMRKSRSLAWILVLENYGMEGFSTLSPDHIPGNSELRCYKSNLLEITYKGGDQNMPLSHLINGIILFRSVRCFSSNKFVQEEYWEIALHHAKGWEPRGRDWTARHPESLCGRALPLPGDCNYWAAWERSLWLKPTNKTLQFLVKLVWFLSRGNNDSE